MLYLAHLENGLTSLLPPHRGAVEGAWLHVKLGSLHGLRAQRVVKTISQVGFHRFGRVFHIDEGIAVYKTHLIFSQELVHRRL